MKKYANKLEITIVWKQVRYQKQVKDGDQRILYNFKVFAIPILTAI